MPYLPKGYVFKGPNEQSYTLTRDVELGDFMFATDFKPSGGAPTPVEGELMPLWLLNLVSGDLPNETLD